MLFFTLARDSLSSGGKQCNHSSDFPARFDGVFELWPSGKIFNVYFIFVDYVLFLKSGKWRAFYSYFLRLKKSGLAVLWIYQWQRWWEVRFPIVYYLVFFFVVVLLISLFPICPSNHAEREREKKLFLYQSVGGTDSRGNCIADHIFLDLFQSSR